MAEPTTAPIKHPDRFFIDGSWAAASSAAKIDVVSSSTEELFARIAEAQAPDVERAVAAARKAFDRGPWPRMKHAERAKYLRAIAQELAKRTDDLAQIWTTESGVVHGIAKGGSGAIGGIYEYYAGLADTFPFVEEHKPGVGSGKVGLLVREPVGVVTAIIPWNAPSSLIAYKCAPALLAGCTVILKMSPEAPGAGYVLAEVCEAIGLPAGVHQRAHGQPRGVGAARPPPRRRQGDVHGLDGSGTQDRRDLRRAHRALHARARRQVGRRDPGRLRRRQGGRDGSWAARRS